MHNRKFGPGILSKQLPWPLVATSSLSLLLSGVSLSWLDVAPSWLLINGLEGIFVEKSVLLRIYLKSGQVGSTLNFMTVDASRQAGWEMRSGQHVKQASTLNHTHEAKC